MDKRSVSNADIAVVFRETADILEVEGANPYRIRAYRNAARTIEGFGGDIAEIIRSGRELPKLPGIGTDLLGKIHEIVDTGTCKLLQRLHREVPQAIVNLLEIAGLGPKRVKLLYHDLGVETAEQLLAAARAGKVRHLHGFGAKTEQKLLATLEAHLVRSQRVSIATASAQAEQLVHHLRQARDIGEVTVAGSLRRRRETIGDVDILAITAQGRNAVDHFLTYGEIGMVTAAGATRASIVLKSGLQVDLRVLSRKSAGSALVYFTGSKAHNIAIRRHARKRGLKISEYGVFRKGTRIAGSTETSVYKSMGLPLIAPELREDRGEIEAAAAGRLPRLVTRDDLRGDLHAHTRASDGANSLEDMAAAAREAGLEYLAITDHSRRLRVTHSLDARTLLRQCDAIDALNARLHGITLLKGIEMEILEDGKLDLPDRVLGRLDLVVGAVHSHFNLPRKKQTTRLLRAMDHRYITILAHPSCRLLQRREPIDVDMGAVIRAAAQRSCYLELNADPARLDMNDVYCREARDAGVLISINSDAHSIHGFANLEYGIGQARRGWLEKKNVLNTRPLPKLLQYLKDVHQQ